jgi:hypothetical protein
MQTPILGPDGSPVSFVEMNTAWHEDRSDNSLTLSQEQFIPGWFLDQLADLRQASTNTRAGNFHLMASIPEVVVQDLRQRYGFDVLTEPVTETMKILHRYALDHFIASNKRI